MDRHQLEYFIAIVEHASFTRAAASLRVAQPSLSRAMKLLEHEWGVELFRRTGRDIVVTDVALELADRARMIVRDFDALAAAAHASSGPVGRVMIATTASTAIEPLTPVASELLATHPGLTVVGFHARNGAEVVAAVDTGRCEIGICGQVSKPFGRNIVADQIGHGEIILLSPPGSRYCGLRSVPPRSLRGERFVMSPLGTTARQVFEHMAGDIQEYTVAVEVAHREAILPMVLGGLGVALHGRTWTALAEQAGAGVSSLKPAVLVPRWLVRRPELSESAQVFADAFTAAARVRSDEVS